MILYHKTENSTIIVEHSDYHTIIHVREWTDNQPIKDARIELDKEQLKEFKNMLNK